MVIGQERVKIVGRCAAHERSELDLSSDILFRHHSFAEKPRLTWISSDKGYLLAYSMRTRPRQWRLSPFIRPKA